MAGIRTWREGQPGSPWARLAIAVMLGGSSAIGAWAAADAMRTPVRPQAARRATLEPVASVLLAAPLPVVPWRRCAAPSVRRGQAGGSATPLASPVDPGRLVSAPLATPSTTDRPGSPGQAGGCASPR